MFHILREIKFIKYTICAKLRNVRPLGVNSENKSNI